MLEFGLLTVGKVKDKNLLSAILQYQTMIKPYVVLHVFELKAEKFSDSNKIQAQKNEQNNIKEFIKNVQKKDDWQPILLTESGKSFDSIGFSKWLSNLNGKSLFIIGGSLGFSDEFKDTFKTKISLSNLTMPHELARLVLMKQFYRAATILNNKTYNY